MSTTSYQCFRLLSISTSSSLTPGATSFLLVLRSQAISASRFLRLAPISFSISLICSEVKVMSPWTLPTDTTILLPPWAF